MAVPLLACALLLLLGSAAADTCSYCDGDGNRLSCYVASDEAPLCEWKGDYKVLPSCFDSAYTWSSSGTHCDGSEESHACPDTITSSDGKQYTLMAIRPWDGACPDAEATDTECSGEFGCFEPPESEGELVRKLLEADKRKLLEANRRSTLEEANKRKLLEANRRSTLEEANKRKLLEANRRSTLEEANKRKLLEANRRSTLEEANKRKLLEAN